MDASDTSSLPPGYVLHYGYPSVSHYLHLRSATGLSPKTTSQAAAVAAGSWFGCYVTFGQEEASPIGMGRIIGDGGWLFHIADMAVHPDYQKKGLRDAILKTLLQRIAQQAPTDGKSHISLFADEAGRKSGTNRRKKAREFPADKIGASKGAIAMIYISGVGWALGWNSIQYLLTAELFLLRICALAGSMAMTVNFVNQYGSSRAVPNMLLPAAQDGVGPQGTFWFFAVVTILGGLWFWFSVPETAGRTLESMDCLFAPPWYKVGLHGNRHVGEQDHEKLQVQTHEVAEQVERPDPSGRV